MHVLRSVFDVITREPLGYFWPQNMLVLQQSNGLCTHIQGI